MTQHLLQSLVVILVLGLVSQWLAWRLRLPAILFLLASGLLVGPLVGILHPAEEFGEWFRPLIRLCVAIILFEGGLNLRRHELRRAGPAVRRLVSVGVLFSWVLYAVAARYLGALSWPVALVFGAIVVVTGPTVILPLLRHVALQRHTSFLLKWEGIVNDPIGALLAVLVTQYFVSSGSGNPLGQVALELGLAILVSVLGGLGAAYLVATLFRRGLVPEYLKAPILFGMVLVLFALVESVQHEAGLLAVTLMGVVVAHLDLPSIEEIRRFKEALTILLVSLVFILLTASLDPEMLRRFDPRAVLVVAAVVLLARPVAVALSTLGADISWRERLLVGWIAPRGIVAASMAGVFAFDMLEAGYDDARVLIPYVFLLIFVTVVLNGLTLRPLAAVLGLTAERRKGLLIVGASSWTTELCRVLREAGLPVLLVDNSWRRLKQARLADTPVFWGEVLSERAEQELELSSYTLLLAATSNDAYNSLICTSLAPEFGRTRVFQLPVDTAEEEKDELVTSTRRGIVAFGSGAEHEKLRRRMAQGWRFRKSVLSEEYTYEQLRADQDPRALEIAIIGADGSPRIVTPGTSRAPGAGDRLIAFVPPRESEDAAESKRAGVAVAKRGSDETNR